MADPPTARLGGGLPALLALLAPGRDPAVLRYAAEAVGLLIDGDAAARELVAALDGAEKLRQARAAGGTQAAHRPHAQHCDTVCGTHAAQLCVAHSSVRHTVAAGAAGARRSATRRRSVRVAAARGLRSRG